MSDTSAGGRDRGADPFAGLTAGECALLRRAPLPRVVDPMKAVLTTDRFSDSGWIFERKLDGIRCIASRDDRGVRLASRNDLSFNERFPEIAQALWEATALAVILDGEVVAFDG